MALIKDNYDPSGYGMFSKVGRFTSEKHSIIRKKEEILYNQGKQHYQPTNMTNKVSEYNNTLQHHQETKPPVEFTDKDLKYDTNGKARSSHFSKNATSFSKSCSRNKIQNIEKSKTNAPPLGIYTPKDIQVHKGTRIYRKDILNKTMNRKSTDHVMQNSGEEALPKMLKSQAVLGKVFPGGSAMKDLNMFAQSGINNTVAGGQV